MIRFDVSLPQVGIEFRPKTTTSLLTSSCKERGTDRDLFDWTPFTPSAADQVILHTIGTEDVGVGHSTTIGSRLESLLFKVDVHSLSQSVEPDRTTLKGVEDKTAADKIIERSGTGGQVVTGELGEVLCQANCVRSELSWTIELCTKTNAKVINVDTSVQEVSRYSFVSASSF